MQFVTLDQNVDDEKTDILQVFDPSAAAAANTRRSRNQHHPPQPPYMRHGNSARFPFPANGQSGASSSPRSLPSPSAPLRSTSLPTPHQGRQQERVAGTTVDGTSNDGRGSRGSGRATTDSIDRPPACHRGGFVTQNGLPGGGSGDDGSEMSRKGLGMEEGVGDAVDAELLAKSLDAVRHRVKHYRMNLKPSFQVQRFHRVRPTD